MSRFRYVILPRVRLALSALALCLGLWVLWLSLERPMPTIALACRQEAAATFAAPGALLASGPARLEGYHTEDAWALLRTGSIYTVVSLERRAGLLWTASGSYQIDPAPYGSPELLVFDAANAYWWDPPGEMWRDGYDPFDSVTESETIPLAVCTNPAVVRLEGEFLVLGGWEDPEEARAERAVPITWRPVDNGVWAGDAVHSPIPPSPDNPNRLGGTFTYWCRGYDAGGNLVCSFDNLDR